MPATHQKHCGRGTFTTGAHPYFFSFVYSLTHTYTFYISRDSPSFTFRLTSSISCFVPQAAEGNTFINLCVHEPLKSRTRNRRSRSMCGGQVCRAEPTHHFQYLQLLWGSSEGHLNCDLNNRIFRRTKKLSARSYGENMVLRLMNHHFTSHSDQNVIKTGSDQ